MAHLSINEQKLYGTPFGKILDESEYISGELVFQTGMTGYLEALTDPSYKNQILVLTYPLIGNYGVPDMEYDVNGILKHFESNKIHVAGLIVGEYCDQPSNYNSKKTLDAFLKEHNTPALCGIDTRNLTLHIRNNKPIIASIMGSNNISLCDVHINANIMDNLIPQVSTNHVIEYNKSDDNIKVLVVDCGIKNNQLRLLLKDNVYIKQVPYDYNFTKESYDRLFISNGPGNPSDSKLLIDRLKYVIENRNEPIFGICYGHQLIALANGYETFKMDYGNRGHNIPCRLIGSNNCYITSQNHGYCVNIDSTRNNNNMKELFINANDGTNEGLIHKTKPIFSTQFHPEGKGGPSDTEWLFDIFLNNNIDLLRNIVEVDKTKKYKKVLILGSGGLCIGQSGEFDYSGSQAIKAYNELKMQTILINPNVATIQTSPGFADKVYFLPVDTYNVTQVIELERPDCIAISFGGQTALNCGIELNKNGILKKFNIDVLGTSINDIIKAEDRDKFKQVLTSVGEDVIPGFTCTSKKEALKKIKNIIYPVLVRSAFALGGLGSGFANNDAELIKLLDIAFSHSEQVTIDKSLKGFKEVEYEIVRDIHDNCFTICNMENIDPLGIHTGESIVVAPSQTLTNDEYHMLRDSAIRIAKKLNIIGECNVQFALDPYSSQYYVIEVNPRLSRSSALASKATGYPIAYVAAKLSIGESVYNIKNSITNKTSACFEPSLDYCVVKIPRWDLKKFPQVSTTLNSAMKSIGESMAISRSFEEAFQKAIRMTCQDHSIDGFVPNIYSCDDSDLKIPTPTRMFSIATSLYNNAHTIDELYKLTQIDKWFLNKFQNIINNYHTNNIQLSLSGENILKYKKLGFSDVQISNIFNTTALIVRNIRENNNIYPFIKRIDTVSGEYPCETNYLYSTYNANYHDINFNNNPVIVLGSGVYKIGSSVEFDRCAVTCIRELRKLGKKVIMINCNPETVSTDYDEADKLYFDELCFESVLDIYQLEKAQGIILSMGGQIPNNIAMPLYRQNVNIIGTSAEMIDSAENRFKFSRLLDNIDVDQPKWKELTSIQEAKYFCRQVEYPCLIRPSYVLSGAAMNIAYSDEDLTEYLSCAKEISKDQPVVISKFIIDAKEIEVDAVANNGKVVLIAISEHIENAGVHSGDATLVLPPHDLTERTQEQIKQSVYKIAKSLNINGPFNIQFIAKDDKVKVIECNLRVSRSFPFVSQTLNVDFIGIATKLMLGLNIDIPKINKINYTGVKVSKFSFDRLPHADVKLGVDMVSTGEVACFGKNHKEAFIKAIIASGFKFPKKNILLSVGSYKFKKEILEYCKILNKLNFNLYATVGTTDYLKEQNINVTELALYSNNNSKEDTIMKYLANKKIDLVIIISQKNKTRCINDVKTNGYKIRRFATDNNIPVITDIKKAKLIISCIEYMMNNKLKINNQIDCKSKYKTIILPGMIDVHVHLRDLKQAYKEDFNSGTKAALAGGITAVCAMPNTDPAITDEETFNIMDTIANNTAHCDYAIFVGANSNNSNIVHKFAHKTAALKLYLNNTFGPLLLSNTLDWFEHVKNWPNERPICVHAESKVLPAILHIANIHKKHIHVCHVARREEIEIIKASKKMGMNITCEVAPHHLFLSVNNEHELGCCSPVKPNLMTIDDQQSLWDNMDIIDCFATDHAPHMKSDKIECSCPGYPGLETALPLLLTAVKNGRLTLEDVVNKYHHNPKKIFNLPEQPDTYIEVDMDTPWVIPNKMKYCKSDWTPFTGIKVYGMIKRVVLRGKTVYLDGDILSNPGYGHNMREINNVTNTIHNIVDNDVESDLIVTPKIKYNKLKNIISVENFNKDMLRTIFKRADDMRNAIESNAVIKSLKGKIIGSIFYEPSTRTKCSFVAAIKKLGGKVLEIRSDESSVNKGETLEDFIKCMTCYCDGLILRTHSCDLNKLTNCINKPIINAGNGSIEHPTQALLDIYTIRNERGTVNNLTITFVGDLKYGRTVHSLVKILCLYNVRINYVSPKELKMPQDVIRYVDNYNISQNHHNELSEELLKETDILYVTRMQKERFENDDYNNLENYKITPKLINKCKSNVVIMHPLPRVDEISTELDTDPRAAYFRQMQNGLYVRMALLDLIEFN